MDYLEFRQSLAHSCITVNGTELAHHGMKNQKWGQRNALWYPISAWKDSLKRKPKKQVQEEKNQVARANGDLPDGPHDGMTSQERVKDAVAKSGDLNRVMQNKDLFTTQELTDIANRYRAETTINQLIEYQQKNASPIGKAVGFIDKYSKYVGTVADAINTASKINNSLKSVAAAYADYTEIQNNGGYVKNEYLQRQKAKNKLQEEEFKKKQDEYEKKQNEYEKRMKEFEKQKSEIEKNKAVTDALNKRSNEDLNRMKADAAKAKSEAEQFRNQAKREAEKSKRDSERAAAEAKRREDDLKRAEDFVKRMAEENRKAAADNARARAENERNKDIFKEFMKQWAEEQRRKNQPQSTGVVPYLGGLVIDADWREI